MNVKGSQYQVQQYVNVYSDELNEAILQSSPSLLSFINRKLTIQWQSPLKVDNYYEYRDDFLKTLFLKDREREKYENQLRKYWAARGPVWDGLATIVSDSGEKGMLLLEAKSHINETRSKIKATSIKSKEVIYRTIDEVKQAVKSAESIDPWVNEYYQLANRLSFLYILNEKLNIPTWLILCNFIQDETHIATNLHEWLLHYKEVFDKLRIDFKTDLMSRFIQIYIHAKE